MRQACDSVGRDVERLLRDGVDPPGGDGSLLRRFLEARDESAFEAIVDRHGPLVLALCKRYLHDPADVDDAFQATFLVLVRKGAGLCEAETLAGWLYAVAHRVAVRARSNVLKRRSREGDREGVHRATAQEERPVDDSLEVLDGELSRLPEKYRVPLVLCYLRGRTHDQAAAELDWPVGTVRSRMAKGRSILHGRMSRRGLDASACLTAARADLAAVVVPSSLVAATTTAAGRFAAIAAGLGWIWRASPSSIKGPAALAEGVLSTMSTTPWKLLGFAFLSTGLAAGALAFAAGPPSEPVIPEEPPKPQAPPESKPEAQAAETASKNVEDRLSEVERKLDRLIGLMEKPPVTAVPGSPAIGGQVNSSAPRSFDSRGLREIEAELINNYQRYDHTRKLVEKHVVSPGELDMLVAPARLLVARLREMEDFALKEEGRAKEAARIDQVENLRQELDRTRTALNEAKEAIKKVGVSEEQLEAFSYQTGHPTGNKVFLQRRGGSLQEQSEAMQNLNDLMSDPVRKPALMQYLKARTDLKAKAAEQEALKGPIQQYEESRARTLAIQKLITWAKEHFKNVELTIDDAVKAR